MTDSSEAWVEIGDRSPAYKLVEAGFNVFMGNNRGNKYSRKHETLNPDTDSEKFFDYSFYEMGEHDATSQINYILNITNKAKIAYIGHSQGTTQMFSSLSENHGNLNDKINVFVALAPVASQKYQGSASEKAGLGTILDEAVKVCRENEIYEFGASIPIIKKMKQMLDPFGLFPKDLENKLQHNVSVKQLLHFGQMEYSEHF